MANRLNIRVKGIDKILKAMSKMPKEVQFQVNKELSDGADEMMREAINRAPKDEGGGGGITSAINVRHGADRHEVYMQKEYGVYQEFGTKGKFKAPSFLGSYPARFRGKSSGTYEDAIKSITGWVRRKGISGTYSVKTKRRTGNKVTKEKQDKQAAYLILRKILREGLKPQPFFFPSFLIVRERLVSRIKKIIKQQVRS
jgi:hypothetical protein